MMKCVWGLGEGVAETFGSNEEEEKEEGEKRLDFGWDDT